MLLLHQFWHPTERIGCCMNLLGGPSHAAQITLSLLQKSVITSGSFHVWIWFLCTALKMHWGHTVPTFSCWWPLVIESSKDHGNTAELSLTRTLASLLSPCGCKCWMSQASLRSRFCNVTEIGIQLLWLHVWGCFHVTQLYVQTVVRTY